MSGSIGTSAPSEPDRGIRVEDEEPVAAAARRNALSPLTARSDRVEQQGPERLADRAECAEHRSGEDRRPEERDAIAVERIDRLAIEDEIADRRIHLPAAVSGEVHDSRVSPEHTGRRQKIPHLL